MDSDSFWVFMTSLCFSCETTHAAALPFWVMDTVMVRPRAPSPMTTLPVFPLATLTVGARRPAHGEHRVEAHLGQMGRRQIGVPTDDPHNRHRRAEMGSEVPWSWPTWNGMLGAVGGCERAVKGCGKRG